MKQIQIKNKWTLNKKENEKTLKMKKIDLEKRLKTNNEEMEKIKSLKKKCQYIVNKDIDCIFLSFLIENNSVKTSRVQLPYGEVIDRNRETVKLDPPKNYRASEYFKFLPYLHDVEKPNFQTSTSNIINNRPDLRNYLLTTGDIGKSIQENLKSLVTDGKRNDEIILNVFDTKYKHILVNLNSLQVKFKDIKKFDA